MRKLAILSNVNTDFVLKLLSKRMETVSSVGYGDVWGQILNPHSILNSEAPDIIVLTIDIEELLGGCTDNGSAKTTIDEWFEAFDSAIKSDKDYFISDAIFRNHQLTENDSCFEEETIHYWMSAITKRMSEHNNVHVLHLNSRIEAVGKHKVFSDKMWYMGKIPYTNEGCRIVAEEIENAVSLLERVTKKVLVLDLDNTLWGGVLGELGVEGIQLSDDHIGAVYKKVQQEIKQIKDTGIILAIASKNNEEDVQEVWDKHPHMLLKKEDFVSIKINWEDKAENIKNIARKLNLGLDSFVFVDDMAPERENIKMRLPGVVVPDFPDTIDDYPQFIESLYNTYFKRIRLSSEDKVKTQQYAENAKREEASKGLSFDDFIMSLDLRIDKVELNDVRLDRIVQMHGKTNQFNLTTHRYTRQDVDKMLTDGYRIYAYNVRDKFGDYGLVAVVIVDPKATEINSFLMSCRVMGKLVENYIIDDVENELLSEGFTKLSAKYIRTPKNTPVENLFDMLGYDVVKKSDDETDYRIDLQKRPKRKYYANRGGQAT